MHMDGRSESAKNANLMFECATHAGITHVGTHESSFRKLIAGAASVGFMSFMPLLEECFWFLTQHIYRSYAFRYSQVHLIRALIPFPIKYSLSFNLNHDQFNKSVICFICMVILLRCSKMRNDNALRINPQTGFVCVYVCASIAAALAAQNNRIEIL